MKYFENEAIQQKDRADNLVNFSIYQHNLISM